MRERREEQRRARSSSILGNAVYDVKRDPASQQLYFVSHATGLSSWECPQDFEFLPKHYEEHVDPTSNCPYWQNKLTGESSWDKPLCMLSDETISIRLPPPPPQPQPQNQQDYQRYKDDERGDNISICAVENCTGAVEKGGYCKTHYDIHLLDVSTRSRRNSGFAGTCGAPGCTRNLYRAGYCTYHFNDHQRNLVDHQARDKCLLEEEAKRNGTAPTLYSREVVQLQAKARREEERRQADRRAAEQFQIAQRDRLAAMEKIKERQMREQQQQQQQQPPPPPPPQQQPQHTHKPEQRQQPVQNYLEEDYLKQKLEQAEKENEYLRNEKKIADDAANSAQMAALSLKDEADFLREHLLAADDENYRIRHEMELLRDKQSKLEEERKQFLLIEESLDVQMTHLKEMQIAQVCNDEETLRYKDEAQRLRREKAELKAKQKESRAKEEELKIQITHLKDIETQVMLQVQESARQLPPPPSAERQKEIDDQNYNLKIAEALRKVEEEKRLRLQEEAAERRKQMELELQIEKNRGSNKGDIKGNFLY